MNAFVPWLTTAGASLSLVLAWWEPGSPICALFGWTAALLYCAALNMSQRRLTRLYAAGLAVYTGGFYWLFSTIEDFGGFPTVAALSVFALFVVGSAIQFLFWGFLYGQAPRLIKSLGMASALSWLAAHHFWVKIFPWDFAHTQIAFLPFIQAVDLGGVTLLTFLMFWISECIVARKNVKGVAVLASLISFVATLGYGWWRIDSMPALMGAPLRIVMVQGNVSIEHKHNIKMITVNRDHYMKVSSETAERDTLVIWPESTITQFVPDQIRHANFSPLLPHLGNGSAFLVGGLTYRSREELFNSSILVRPDGSIPQPYHKMVLMPFGEYTPLSSLFPWLKDINSTAGSFTAGADVEVMEYETSTGSTVRLSPLICYEDVIPGPSQEASMKGAELIVTQTNDAWFGDTVAPYQHHMIAAFRAIENRRFLLRSTNTGLTAVVDPLGRTIASLLPFTEGTLPWEVNLMQEKTLYASYPIRSLWLVVALIYVVATLVRGSRRA